MKHKNNTLLNLYKGTVKKCETDRDKLINYIAKEVDCVRNNWRHNLFNYVLEKVSYKSLHLVQGQYNLTKGSLLHPIERSLATCKGNFTAQYDLPC